MIYKFRCLTPESESFFADFEIDSTQTFYDLHQCVQKSLNYDEGQMASFFLCNDDWEKEMEITLIDMTDAGGKSVNTMERIKIGQCILDLHQKLLYVFDFFSERALFMELIDQFPEVKGTKYPICSALKGNIPPQISLDEEGFDDLDFDDEE